MPVQVKAIVSPKPMSTRRSNRRGSRFVDFEPFPLPLDICFVIFGQLSVQDVLHLRQVSAPP